MVALPGQGTLDMQLQDGVALVFGRRICSMSSCLCVGGRLIRECVSNGERETSHFVAKGPSIKPTWCEPPLSPLPVSPKPCSQDTRISRSALTETVLTDDGWREVSHLTSSTVVSWCHTDVSPELAEYTWRVSEWKRKAYDSHVPSAVCRDL